MPRRASLPSLVLAVVLLFLSPLAHAQAVDLCQGAVQDKQPRPMTALAKPAPGQAAREPQFGTLIRRVSAAAPISGEDTVVKPVYSTTSAWNADESLMILYRVGKGHQLYDGRDYSFIRQLPMGPNEIEGFFWHTGDPDLLFYLSGKQLIRHHVSTDVKDVVRTFTCSGVVSADPHGFMSWDSDVFALRCSGSGQSFYYRISTNAITGSGSVGSVPPLMGASGTLADRNGDVVNTSGAFQRTLDLSNPFDHASLGRYANGHDTFNGVQFDPGPKGSGVGTIVSHDMTTGVAKVVVGPATGFPYPPHLTHLSALAYKQPGWVYASIVGNTSGQGLLQNEIVLADTNTGKVCRVGRHRSFGDDNSTLGDSYWAEPHVVASPSGTRALFGSDWGNGPSVDTYAVELPTYVWFDAATRAGDFDGDGKSDLLWVNRDTRAVVLWLMNGAAKRSETSVTALPAGFQLAGVGDFDHDARSDLLLRNAATGALRVRLMNGATVRSETAAGTMADPQRLAATGDLDGDGNVDLVWYNAATRALTLWRMSGSTVLAKTAIATLPNLTTLVVAAADFDGNGRADLLVRDGATGILAVWNMNGATVSSKATFATLADANWQVLGTGDYDGDDRADLLLRHRVSGLLYVSLMSGATVLAEGPIGAIADLNWRTTASGDFDGDGRADIYLRHRLNGATYLLFMNGLALASAAPSETVAAFAWRNPATP